MKTNYETLYRRIGFLFYAEAARNKRLTYSDYEKLKDIVKEKWRMEDGDQKWAGLSDSLFLGIKDAYRESMQAGEATQLFRLYYINHMLAFSDALKDKISATCHDIEHEFAAKTNHNGNAKGFVLERLFRARSELQ